MGCPTVTIRTFDGEEMEVTPLKAWRVKKTVVAIVRNPKNGKRERVSLPSTYPAPCP